MGSPGVTSPLEGVFALLTPTKVDEKKSVVENRFQSLQDSFCDLSEDDKKKRIAAVAERELGPISLQAERALEGAINALADVVRKIEEIRSLSSVRVQLERQILTCTSLANYYLIRTRQVQVEVATTQATLVQIVLGNQNHLSEGKSTLETALKVGMERLSFIQGESLKNRVKWTQAKMALAEADKRLVACEPVMALVGRRLELLRSRSGLSDLADRLRARIKSGAVAREKSETFQRATREARRTAYGRFDRGEVSAKPSLPSVTVDTDRGWERPENRLLPKSPDWACFFKKGVDSQTTYRIRNGDGFLRIKLIEHAERNVQGLRGRDHALSPKSIAKVAEALPEQHPSFQATLEARAKLPRYRLGDWLTTDADHFVVKVNAVDVDTGERLSMRGVFSGVKCADNRVEYIMITAFFENGKVPARYKEVGYLERAANGEWYTDREPAA